MKRVAYEAVVWSRSFAVLWAQIVARHNEQPFMRCRLNTPLRKEEDFRKYFPNIRALA